MWSWTPWSSGQGRAEEKEETKAPQNVAGRQRLPRRPEYYQRSKTKELPPKASKTAAMDKGKVSKHDSSQGKDGLDESYTALDQALKDNQELQRKQADSLKQVAKLEKGNKELKANLATKEAEVTNFQSYRPASTLSTDSERHYTLYSSLSENGSLFQVATDSDILLRLQKDSEGKDDTIKRLEGEVNQLKKRLKYSEQLEEQNFQLTTEESKHEEEKQMLRREVESLKHKASISRPPTRSYAHEQKLQELAQCYEQQYHEELEENSRLREKISQLEKEIQGHEERSTHIDEVGDPEDRECKDDTIKRLEGEVNQLKKRLKYAEQLEEQNFRLITEESKHEEEKRTLRREVDLLKRKASVSRPLTRSYAHEQKLQELTQRYEQQYHEQLEKNSRLQEKISQLEKEIQGQEEGIAHIDEVDDLDLNAGLKRKYQHVHTLEAQVQALQQHSKGQSKQILQLKQELEALKSIPNSSLDEDSLCPSNPIVCQPASTVLEPFEAETSQLEARIVALGNRDAEGEIVRLREQLLAKEEELRRLKPEMVDKTGGRKAAGYDEEAYTHLKRLLELKEKENLNLKSKFAALAAPEKPTPKPRTRDAATDQAADQPPPLDPPTDVVELQKILEEKEAQIARMGQQLQKFEKTATDLTKVVHHTKGQSQIVKELRQQLARAEGEQSQLKLEKDSLAVAKDSVQDEIERLQKSCTGKETALIATQHENSRLKRQLDQLNGEMYKLKEEIEQLKGEKRQLEGRNSQLDSHLRHLQTTMHQDAAKVSLEQGQRIAVIVAKLDEVVKERNNLEQKMIAAMAKFENTNQELALTRVQVTKLTSEVEQLCREKADLLGEVEAKLEEMKQQEKWARKQLESTTENSSKAYQRCQQLEAEKSQLSEQMTKLIGLNDENIAQVNELKAQVRKLKQEKEALQNEVQIAKTEDELAPYKIESFSKLEAGASKGSGSFGSIQLIEVNGIPCIAKRLHDILVGRGQTEVVEKVQKQSIEEKFHKECVFLSRLRHPNIVQFMGVHYGQDPSNLTLIMECLPMDLDKCLQQYPNIPLPTKISILLDVSYGLLHLHSQNPPIIHRDLTAANILLTSDMKAKIADLGVSKILDLHPLHGASQTAGPGALGYMPPEALKRVPAYDTKLDDFSFGVVALYVANQEFPMPEERGTVEALQKQETHIEKRREWVDRVGKSHPLYKLITSCLQDVPDRRPTTSEINTSLKQLSKCHPRRFQDIMEMNQHLSRLENRISASLSDLQSQASTLKKIVEEV